MTVSVTRSCLCFPGLILQIEKLAQVMDSGSAFELTLGGFGQSFFLLGASVFPPVLCGSKYLLRIILAAVKCPGIFE